MSAGSDPSAPAIRRLAEEDLAAWRGVRLRALQDAPEAFCSAYDDEAALDEQGWREKWRAWTEDGRGAVWSAFEQERAVGLVGVVKDRDTAGRAWIISMWVEPAARRGGTGGGLLDAAIAWARAQSFSELRLHVTSGNEPAQRLYEQRGFRLTGESMPHPRQSGLAELEMALAL